MRTALLALLALLILSSPARAGDDVFTVSGVKVDVKAENAVAAREKAFATAQTVAFTALATRLLGDEEAKAYKIPDVVTIATMIKDFEVTNERLSAVEYIGTYTFRFEGPAIRSRFNVQNARVGDTPGKPLLILPFYQVGQVITLWRENNPWLKAWAHADLKGGLVPLNVPLGDALDVGAIADDQALTYKPDSLVEMLKRYSSGEAIILIAKPGSPDEVTKVPNDLSVMIYRTDHNTAEYVQTLKILPDSAIASTDALYDKAVRQVRNMLQKNWKGGGMSSSSAAATTQPPILGDSPIPQVESAYPTDNTSITVHVQFMTMQEWVTARQALQTVPGINDMKVKSVTPREAQVELSFTGGVDHLRTILALSDMVLSGDASGYSLVLKKPTAY